MNVAIKGSSKVFFGKDKQTGENIYLSKPTWDCGGYGGFGYLGNKDCHYHLDGYQSKDGFFTDSNGKYVSLVEKRNISMFDALRADYNLCEQLQNDKNLWQFCELALTAYALKNTAEVLGRGGSCMTSNVCKDIIINQDEVKRINEIVLPAIFNAIAEIFEPTNKE